MTAASPDLRPPITIPSAEFLGRIAYHTWFEADLSHPYIDWMELNEQNATAGRSQNLSATLPVRSLVGWSHLLIGVVPLPLDTVAPTPPWNFKILPVRHRGITMHHRLPLALVLSMLVVSLSSQPQQAQLSLASTPISESMSLPGSVVVVVGDLVPGEAGAPQVDAAAVARLTSQHDPDALIHVGDLQYYCGSTQLFETRYGIHYGAMKPIIRPEIGNHEYCNGSWPDAPGYFAYFGAQAKPSGASYYSWNLILPSGKTVHFLNLNSNCLQWNKIAPGCGMTQAMRTWIREDLAADNSDCVIATWHEPAFGSEVPFHGDGKDAMREVWWTLESRGVDYIITGHAHNYQRYRAMHHDGTTTAPAVASAIVGTGGRSLDDVTKFSWQSKLVALDDRHFGVMKMVFNSTGTGWTQAFKTTSGASLDAVSFGCNNNK